MKIRLQSIRVFCFHQVSAEFDASTMWECDWTQIDTFKERILMLKERYTFISLEEAYHHISHDVFRREKYAVLTADDGWSSLNNILPWLNEQQIPVTLFLNSGYLDGTRIREKGMDKLLHTEDVENLLNKYQLLTIGSHGQVHEEATNQTIEAFTTNVVSDTTVLQQFQRFIPYFAYPCGNCTNETDRVLYKENLIPVYCDGEDNYNDTKCIHRIPIDDEYWQKRPIV